MTRIFNVDFEYQEIWDGEIDDTVVKDNINVAADEGRLAITKAVKELFTPHVIGIEDEETGKERKVKVGYNSICLIGLTLLAEA